MNQDKEDKLYNKYPEMLAGMKMGPEDSCLSFGIECGDGWYNLVDYLLSAIHERQPEVKIEQIKEKFGSLRVYIDSGSGDVFDLIDAAEAISARTCELCGEPGETTRGPWIVTRCDKCRSKL